MSTQHKKEIVKLIPPADVNAEGVSRSSSRCSCSDCESSSCFAKRNKSNKQQCQCRICDDLKNCLALPQVPSKEKRVEPLVEKPSKKIVKETVTTETVESIKKVIETMYEYGGDKGFEMFARTISKLSDTKDVPPKTDAKDAIAKTVDDKTSHVCKIKDDVKKSEPNKEYCRQVPVTDVPSKNDSRLQKDDTTARKLSAQIMNVPYEDLHDDRSDQNSEVNPVTKLNIFKRIKEIYDACSCKVCECISSKPLPIGNEFCKCHPCDCAECASLRRKIDESIKRIPHSGCPCIRCDRKDCRGIVKDATEQQDCDCKPCECIQCTESFSKPCNCEPCQCVDCKSLNSKKLKTVKLSQVNEIFQRETCQCSPCECIECKQIYNRTNPTIMCSASTEMTRYRNCRCENCPIERCLLGEIETCLCERHNRTIKKTFENYYNNFDIQAVAIDNAGPFRRKEHSMFEQNTIALFASMKNSYQGTMINKNMCKCTNCECIVCNAKDEQINRERNARFRSDSKLLQNSFNIPEPMANACKCTPCECEICSNKVRHDSYEVYNKCKCDVCDCLNCDKTSPPTCSTFNRETKPFKITKVNYKCHCTPCDCRNCHELPSCTSHNIDKNIGIKTSRRQRKVMLISPTESSGHLDSKKSSCKNVSSITLSPKKSNEAIFQHYVTTIQSITKIDHSPENDQNHQFYRDKYYNDIDDGKFAKNKHDRTADNSQEGLRELKCKQFKIIHQKPIEIVPNDSEESLPVFWTCHNRTLYPGNISRHSNMDPERSESNPVQDFSKYEAASVSYNVNDELDSIENINETQNIIASDKKILQKSHVINHLEEDFKDCYSERNHVPIFRTERDVLRLDFQRTTEPFSKSIIDKTEIKTQSLILDQADLKKSYEKATKVLREAKAFSSKLIKMLDGLETANREFESASEKFKNLHKSFLDVDKSIMNRNTTVNILTNSTNEVVLDDILGNRGQYEKRAHQNIKNENEAEKEYEQFTSNAVFKPDNLSSNLVEENAETIVGKDMDSIKDTANSVGISKQKSDTLIQGQEFPSDEPVESCSLINRISQDLTNNYTDLKKNIKSEAYFSEPPAKDSNNINKEKPRKLSNSVFSEPTVEASILTEDIETMQNSREQGDKNNWDIFKKNLYLNGEHAARNNRMFSCPALELEIKEAIQAIALRAAHDQNLTNNVLQANETSAKLDSGRKSVSSTASSQTYSRVIDKADKEVYFNSNQIPEERHRYSEFDDIRKISFSQFKRTMKTDCGIARNDEDCRSVMSTKRSSCDALKACFVGLRRVSDHTVLVKWNVPKRIKEVQGYELLVDGRAVQTILSPLRSMAVVSCLPNAARVLLTIRTIAQTALSPHMPASSIVYRPRNKY